MLEKDKLYSNKNVAFISTVILGLLIHMFGLVNTVHNYDDIAVMPFGFGSSITSGRWFLGILGGCYHLLFGSYNLPFVNGVIFLLIMGIAAGMLVSIFKIKSLKLSALVGAIFISFPSSTSILFFKYTAPYYAFAILLAILAAKVIIESKRKAFLSLFLSAVFTALSLGIYQAYLPITVAILVIFLIKKCLDSDESFYKIFKTGIYYCLGIIAGLLLYKVVLDLIIYGGNAAITTFSDLIYSVAGVKVETFSLSNYQGIDQMGKITLASLPSLIYTSYSQFVLIPFIDYCDLAQTLLLKVVYILIYVSTLIMIIISLISKKKKVNQVLMITLLCILYPIAINLIVLMCPNSYIYTLMIHSFVLVPCTPLFLWESCSFLCIKNLKFIKSFKKSVLVVLMVMVAGYSVLDNVNYSYMYYNTQQAKNYVSSIVTQVRMTEGFDVNKKWFFAGKIKDPLFNGAWDDVPIYGGNRKAQEMLNMYSRNSWISNYVGYSISWANDKTSEVKETEEFKNMPCYPNEGSIKVIGDYVVVKFEE